MQPSPKALTQTSKFLSLVLRHKPEEIGLVLDEAGWASTDELIDACNRHGPRLDLSTLQLLVNTNEKKRFEFNADGSRIRASQGHSVEVDLGYTPQVPPAVLYHGTVEDFLDPIRSQGLVKGERHHVHLSADPAIARIVGTRRCKPVVLTVQASTMHTAGHPFYLSTNGVWLTDHVPASFIDFPS
ncbi:RNA 2'-phosphotransferase [Verrucomicrobium sp. BvORR106]|uniref:RNA 2'-phosphotransferase n=1 Tax=Verrucomicrobium sp. BvORR106 TaxID=1403819 RepID=UPI00056EFDD0|nr:RNA 2'-phosphotransferase [Verrucomicrobium sp. BvORR106]